MIKTCSTALKTAALFLSILTMTFLVSCTTNDAPVENEITDEPASLEEMYMDAVRDAVFIEDDEKLPVLTVTKDEDLMIWNEDRVLMVTYHKFPQSYTEGKTTVNDWGDVWVTSFAEWQEWYKKNYSEETQENWSLRFNQLLGMPPENDYTHFSAFWVDPSDLIRPAYNPDIESSEIFEVLPNDCDEEYTKWFKDNIIYSYFEDAYPWTRLGYTYDWADNGTEYGLSEFLLKQGSEIYVEFTCTDDEYVDIISNKNVQMS